MKKLVVTKGTSLRVNGLAGFLKRTVTKFGNGAKVDCPKEFLGKAVYLVILEDGIEKRS